MVFTSLVYVIFLILVVVLYFSAPDWSRRGLLLVASYLFYAYWKPQYLLMLLSITTVDYVSALQIEKASRPAIRNCWLGLSIFANLGLLLFYKYYDFFASQFNLLSSWGGWGGSLPVLDLLIPLGISFHTFQSISYTVDVYRGAYKAEKSYLNLSLFITFFPQLVAGPIERASHLVPQLARVNRFNIDSCMNGALLVAYGMFKKLVLADNLAILVDQYFGSDGYGSGGLCLVAVYAFALQIYFDFSGYTDVARGSGRMLGIGMVENFRAPYLSTTVREFWRRWHISLTDWFREFVYKPLINRGLGRSTCVLVVFALSGMWHGANWTFLIWGLLNAGFYFIMGDDRAISHLADASKDAGAASRAMAVVRCLLTFNMICITWIFFRASDMTEALRVLWNIGTMGGSLGSAIARVVVDHPSRLAIILGALAVDCALELRYPRHKWIDALTERKSWPYWTAFAGLAYVSLLLGQLGAEQFIYFQF